MALSWENTELLLILYLRLTLLSHTRGVETDSAGQGTTEVEAACLPAMCELTGGGRWEERLGEDHSVCLRAQMANGIEERIGW